MKRLLFTGFLLAASHGYSQPVVLSENFNTYNGTIASIPAGFTITWNDSTGNLSYYTSAGSCGLSCNSYKFGVDSATIITPFFSNAGSVRFFFKGNGSLNPQNTFYVYESPDGVTWNQVAAISGFNTSAQTLNFPLSLSTVRLKFLYRKPVLGLNVAFDDLTVLGPVGMQEFTESYSIKLFPTPSEGSLSLIFDRAISRYSYFISNLIGKKLLEGTATVANQKSEIDVSSLADGIYFIHIKTTEWETSRRFVIRR
jgi:hypothetical protein